MARGRRTTDASSAQVETADMCRSCGYREKTGPDGLCDTCGEALGWEQMEYADG